jgi:regulator of RNase E activity RraA
MGDLVATALQARGSVGAVMDGAVRDIAPMIEMDFPIFAGSVSPATPAGRSAVVGYNIPIVCGGVSVRPGDVIVADWDGVVVVPQEHAVEVLEKSLALEESERDLRDHIRANAGKKKLGDLFVGQ